MGLLDLKSLFYYIMFKFVGFGFLLFLLWNDLVKIKAVNKLLLMELPKNDRNISKNDKYLSIKKALESKEGDTEIAFIISIMPVFKEFMTKFQREELMIHISHQNCEKLLKTAMARLMRSKVYTEKEKTL